jgi:hypothetical protein
VEQPREQFGTNSCLDMSATVTSWPLQNVLTCRDFA